MPGAGAPGHQALSSAQWLGFGGKENVRWGQGLAILDLSLKLERAVIGMRWS